MLDGYPPDDLFPFSPPLRNPHLLLDLEDVPSSASLALLTDHTKPSLTNPVSRSTPGPDVTDPIALPGLPQDRKRRRNASAHASRKKKRKQEKRAVFPKPGQRFAISTSPHLDHSTLR